MAYTYDDFLKAANSSGMLQKISSDDLELAKQYPEFGLSMLSLTKDLDSATTAEQKLLATEAADQLRSTYGNKRSAGSYDAKIDSLLNQAANYGSFNYGKETEYQQALNAVTNPDAFSYDLGNDDVWASYRKQYLREGDRAVADTLAKVSAATGGRPSSYAVTAAQQAGDYYNSKLTDMIPTLYQNAYQRYLNDLDIKQAGLAALQSDRSSAYNQHMDGYNMLLTNLGNYQTQSDTAYNRYLNQLQMQQEAAEQAREEQLAKAQLLAEAGDYSLLAQYYGLTDEQVATIFGSDIEEQPTNTNEYTPQFASPGVLIDDGAVTAVKPTGSFAPISGTQEHSLGNTSSAANANTTDEFNGESYAEAVQYMRTYGLDTDVIEGLISKDDWNRAKSNGSQATEVTKYDSYEDYIRAYVQYAMYIQRYPGKVRQPTTSIGPSLMAQ